ncbi:MAG: sugar phosphate isomerase/epimerase family protein [Pedobacter sp.]|jgi:sugar phosphate isomerase/epimerase
MNYTRKEFLQNSTILFAAAMTGSAFTFGKNKPMLAFSTLGCPDWPFKQIVDFAAIHGYSGLELRGIKRQMDLTKCNEFSSQEKINETLSLMKEKGLKFINLGASANMHFHEGPEKEKSINEAKSFIDLAQKINCPYVRVFPNKFPKDRTKDQTISTVAKNLLTLGEYAKTRNVTVLLETHGDFSGSDDILKVMKAVSHPNIALVWDISNMWTITKESPALVYKKLKKYIRHTHIKDARLVGDKLQYVLMGQGDVPIFEAIDILSKDGYKGYYSFEWEKLWHPEIADPEIALADYPIAMKKHFKL